MEENNISGNVEPIESAETKNLNNSSVEDTETKNVSKEENDANKLKGKEPREIFFGGERMKADKDLKSKIQKNLDKTLPGGFVVTDVDIQKKEVSVKIFRHSKNHHGSQPGNIILDDAIVLSGHFQKAEERISLPPHPFADRYHYQFGLDEIKNGYNELMDRRRNRIKEISVESTPYHVRYTLKY